MRRTRNLIGDYSKPLSLRRGMNGLEYLACERNVLDSRRSPPRNHYLLLTRTRISLA